MTTLANPDDLTTVEQVVAQGGLKPDENQKLLRAMVTAISRHFQTRTGRQRLNAAQAYTGVFDGTGADKQFVREYPLQTVTSVSVFGQTVQPSPDGVQPGWIVDSYGASIVLLPGTAIGSPLSSSYAPGLGRFPRGRQNVQIVGTAGYSPNGGPGPHPPGDATYNGAPSDLGQALTEFLVQQYRRRDWVDQASKVIQTGETLQFRAWEMPPWINMVIESYKRSWIV